MSKKRDLVAQRFGRLTVTAEAGQDKNGKALWSCECDCGKGTITTGNSLTRGNTKSCGKCYSNTYRLSSDMSHMIMEFPNGTELLVDIEDYVKVKSYNWYQDSRGYAKAEIGSKLIQLHRFLMNSPPDLQIDHINCNKRDNRKSNLRLATGKENKRNVGVKKNNRTGVKGVYYNKACNKYHAQIKVSGRRHHLGYYLTVLEASEAYDRAAEKYFGEFAWLNNLREKTPELNAGVFPSAAK